MGSGEAREMRTPAVTLPAGVAVEQFYFIKTSDLYAFMSYFVIFALFSHPVFWGGTASLASLEETPLGHNREEKAIATFISRQLFFFVINIFFFFSHITQHSIQNITKQNNRHILNISKSSQKGGREGRTTKTQKLSTIFYFIFSHITQHSIQNITKQNNRHILNISRSNQKGGREGRTIKTQKSLLYNHIYQTKNTAKHQWSKAWPHRLAPLHIHKSLFAGGYGSNMFFHTCAV